MSISIADHLSAQDAERQPLLQAIHDIILNNDSAVTAVVGSMMGKEMILYNCKTMFKYGLASVKDYMSLHAMPIYMNPPLHAKYELLLPEAKFQKGCVNFKNEIEMPLEVVTAFIADCAMIDILAIREKHLAGKKKK